MLVKDLDKEMTVAEAEEKDAQGDYEKAMKDSADKRAANIGAIRKAVAALEKGMGGVFLQSRSATVPRSLVQSMDNMEDSDRQEVTAFLAAEQGTEYAPQGGQVTGILKQMGDEMAKGLADATADEEAAITSLNELTTAKKKEVEALTKAIEVKIKTCYGDAVGVPNGFLRGRPGTPIRFSGVCCGGDGDCKQTKCEHTTPCNSLLEDDAEKVVDDRVLSSSKGRKMSSYSVRSLICPLYRWDRCAKGVCLDTASNSLVTMNGHAMTSSRGRHRRPCWEEGSGTCFPLHSPPWPSRCPRRPRTRASKAWYAHDDTVLAPKGSDSMKRVGTSRVERSVVIRILLLMGPPWAQAYEWPNTGSHIHVYSSAACLRLPSAAAHSAAAARAAADAVAAIRDVLDMQSSDKYAVAGT
jgi:hypothetical protein